MHDGGNRERWRFRPRADGVIPVNLDNNMWDWLFEQRTCVRLSEELPRPRFQIFIPREVEIEHQSIPVEKQELRKFIDDTITENGIQTTRFFGFAAKDGEVERCGSFGFGTFIELDEVARLEEMRNFHGRPRPTGLARNEGDVMLASQSCYSVVLSRDSKPGALMYARERGGKVLTVDNRHVGQGSLRAAILALLES